jgi:hypothetical protein
VRRAAHRAGLDARGGGGVTTLHDQLRAELGDLLAAHDAAPDRLATWAARYGADPAGFARDILGITAPGLWAKQVELVEAVAANRLTTAVSANTVGKTYALAVLVLWWLYCRGPSAVLTLTPTDAQNRNLWREIRSLWLGGPVELPGALMKQGLEIGEKHYAIGRATTEAGRLTGLHHPRLLVVMDEAQALEEWTWGASLQLAGGEENKIVACGNGGPRSGRWYGVCESPAWAHLHVSAWEHPNVVQGREVIPGAVSRQAVEAAAREYGSDSGYYRITILGQFADDAAAQLITRPWVDAAIARWHARDLAGIANSENPFLIGVDVARGGADRTGIVCAQATGHVDELVALRIPDLSLVRQAVEAQLTSWGVRRDGMDPALRPGRAAVVTCDANALGGGPSDELAARGWPVERFFAQGAPVAWDDDKKFVNRRASAAWALRDRFAAGRIAIPPDPELVAEILATQYVHRADGKILLEEKAALRSRLGRSPDLFDALMMALDGARDSFATISASDGIVEF